MEMDAPAPPGKAGEQINGEGQVAARPPGFRIEPGLQAELAGAGPLGLAAPLQLLHEQPVGAGGAFVPSEGAEMTAQHAMVTEQRLRSTT